MTKSKLNQIIAVSKSKKSDAQSALTKVYQTLQKSDQFDGLNRTYSPKDDDGDRFPTESKKVIHKVPEILDGFRQAWTNMFDVVLSQDIGNTKAKADVIINDEVVLKDIPATTLIFLEKQVTDLLTTINACPVISPAENWTFNSDTKLWKSEPVQTIKTKKVSKPIVRYDATPEHPAQTELITEDIVIGQWTTEKLSGALSPSRKQQLIDRAKQLKEAIVKAREEANSLEVDNLHQGEKVLEFIFDSQA